MQTNLLQILQVPSLIHIAEARGLSYATLRASIIRFEPDVRIRYHLHRGKLYFLGDPEKIEVSFQESDVRLGNVVRSDVTIRDFVSEPYLYRPILYQVLDAFFHFKGFEKAMFIKRTGEYGVKRNSIYIADQDIADQKIIKPWGSYRPEGRSLIMPYNDFLKRNDRPGIQRRATEHADLFVHEGFNYHIDVIGDTPYLAIIPRAFITQNRSNLLVGKEFSNLYTRINANRFNWEVRELLNHWADYLSDNSINRKMTAPLGEAEKNNTISIRSPGGGLLMLDKSYYIVEQEESEAG